MSNYRTIDIEPSAAMFSALSNPNRLRLLLRIIDQCGPAQTCSTEAGMGACVGDLAEGLGIAASTVSHHLKELRQAGLISMTRHGRTTECSVNHEALDELATLFSPEFSEPML